MVDTEPSLFGVTIYDFFFNWPFWQFWRRKQLLCSFMCASSRLRQTAIMQPKTWNKIYTIKELNPITHWRWDTGNLDIGIIHKGRLQKKPVFPTAPFVHVWLTPPLPLRMYASSIRHLSVVWQCNRPCSQNTLLTDLITKMCSLSSSSNFPLLEQELSPLSQTQGGFTKAMLSKLYYTLIEFSLNAPR